MIINKIRQLFQQKTKQKLARKQKKQNKQNKQKQFYIFIYFLMIIQKFTVICSGIFSPKISLQIFL